MRLFVDGTALADPSPATVLVTGGHHVVVAQGDGWRDERDIEVKGAGDLVSLLLEPAEAPSQVAPPAPRESERPASPGPVAEPARGDVYGLPRPPVEEAPDGLFWGAAFTIMPAYLLGVANAQAANGRTALTIVAGPTLEIGYALTERFELLARGFVGIGPDAKPSYAYMGGPALSYRIASPVWIGAGFLAGQLETRAHGARYGTDQVFGAMLEAGFVVVKKRTGEWLGSVQPSMLLTEMRQDNTAFFFPFAFGYRGF